MDSPQEWQKLHLFFIGTGKLWEALKNEYPDYSTALEYCFIAFQKRETETEKDKR